jgi:hypothetical protein
MSDKLEWTDYLERIASALEENNRLNREWIETSMHWHQEVEEINEETRVWQKDLEERRFAKDQDWIDWQKQHIQRETEKAAAFAGENYRAYLAAKDKEASD